MAALVAATCGGGDWGVASSVVLHGKAGGGCSGARAWLSSSLLMEALGWVRGHVLRHPEHPWGTWLFQSVHGAAKVALIKRTRRALATPGGYRLSPVSLRRVRRCQSLVECWEAEDAWVLKALALMLTPILCRVLSRHCYHLPGRGGAKGAVRAVREAVASGRYGFVARSDARGYYANIRHATLLHELRRITADAAILDLVCQYCHRTVVFGGLYRFIEKGIPLGCSLSPLMAALYLRGLDERLEGLRGVFYARFMDDWVILAESRWKLRRAVRLMNGALDEVWLEQHPDKTFIGRIERGFDFVGYQFGVDGSLSPSRRAVARLAENISRLYERGADKDRVGRYVENWSRWLLAGMRDRPKDGKARDEKGRVGAREPGEVVKKAGKRVDNGGGDRIKVAGRDDVCPGGRRPDGMRRLSTLIENHDAKQSENLYRDLVDPGPESTRKKLARAGRSGGSEPGRGRERRRCPRPDHPDEYSRSHGELRQRDVQ